jgi:hypothetical protein
MEKPRAACAAIALMLTGCVSTPEPFAPPPGLAADDVAQWKAGCDSGLHVASFGRVGVWAPPKSGVWTRAYVTCRDRFVMLEDARRH